MFFSIEAAPEGIVHVAVASEWYSCRRYSDILSHIISYERMYASYIFLKSKVEKLSPSRY